MQKSDLTTSLIGIWIAYLGVMGLLTTRPEGFAQMGAWISLVTMALMFFIWFINRPEGNANKSADAPSASRFGGPRFGDNTPQRFGGSGLRSGNSSNSSSGFGSGNQRPSSPFGGGNTSRFGSSFGTPKPGGSPFGKRDDNQDDGDKNIFGRLSKFGKDENPFARADDNKDGDDNDKKRPSSFFFSSQRAKTDENAPTRPNQEEDAQPVDLPSFFEDAIRDVLQEEGRDDDSPQGGDKPASATRSQGDFTFDDSLFDDDDDDDDEIYIDDDFYDDDDDDDDDDAYPKSRDDDKNVPF